MFIPDQRNLGGRQIITNMVWNHRLSLNNMEEKSAFSPLQTKLHTPRQGCYTDRQQSAQNKPSLFFRRLLYKKPLSFPKGKSKKEFKEFSNLLIDWNKVQKDLVSIGKEFYKLDLQQFFTKLAKQLKITKQYDFATLIELILQIYPKTQQDLLIEIASDVVVDMM